MIWSKEETLSRSEIEKIQLERLQETVSRVYNKVPAYRAKMDAVGVKPEDIKSLKDLAKDVPDNMCECISLNEEERLTLQKLLYKLFKSENY